MGMEIHPKLFGGCLLGEGFSGREYGQYVYSVWCAVTLLVYNCLLSGIAMLQHGQGLRLTWTCHE